MIDLSNDMGYGKQYVTKKGMEQIQLFKKGKCEDEMLVHFFANMFKNLKRLDKDMKAIRKDHLQPLEQVLGQHPELFDPENETSIFNACYRHTVDDRLGLFDTDTKVRGLMLCPTQGPVQQKYNNLKRGITGKTFAAW